MQMMQCFFRHVLSVLLANHHFHHSPAFLLHRLLLRAAESIDNTKTHTIYEEEEKSYTHEKKYLEEEE